MNTKNYRKLIMVSVVLYECETLSLILRKCLGLRVFEDRMLRSFFGPKRKDLIGGW
jgi:hypothetical protein